MKKIVRSSVLPFLSWVAATPTLWSQASAPASQGNDFLIIPDVRAGPITRHWTGADIELAFGILHCRREVRDFSQSEEGDEAGMVYTVYLVYPDTPDELEIMLGPDGKAVRARLETKWADITNPKTGAVERGPVRTPSRWQSKSGITLGSDVAKVEQVNGGPFEVMGWETDGGPGQVFDWKGGKIPDSFRVTFNSADQEVYGRVWGEATTSQSWTGLSNGPWIPKLDLFVSRIDIAL